MAAAVLGIYGNSKQEAMYPVYAVDADGQKLDGANRYTLRFAPGQLPPVNAFWSLTMYELPAEPARGQSDQPLPASTRRCCRSSRRDADGGLTLYIQNESPGKDKEANWLPAPKGPFMHDHAPLLAEGGSARRQVDRTAAEKGGSEMHKPIQPPKATQQ